MEFTFLADLSNVLRNYQTDAMKPYYFNQIFISTTYPNFKYIKYFYTNNITRDNF